MIMRPFGTEEGGRKGRGGINITGYQVPNSGAVHGLDKISRVRLGRAGKG